MKELKCPKGYRNINGKCKMFVIFRKYRDGEIIALFPDTKADMRGNCMSYQHIGQHGAADYNWVVSNTQLATLREYKKLYQELLRQGYKKDELEIRKKWMR